jgi:hypothetical protein
MLFMASYLSDQAFKLTRRYFNPWNTSRYHGYYENHLIVVRVSVIFLWGKETDLVYI